MRPARLRRYAENGATFTQRDVHTGRLPLLPNQKNAVQPSLPHVFPDSFSKSRPLIPCPKTASPLRRLAIGFFQLEAGRCRKILPGCIPPFSQKIPVLTADFLSVFLQPAYIAVPYAGPECPKRKTARSFLQPRKPNRRVTGPVCSADRNLLRGCLRSTLRHLWPDAPPE